MIKPRIIIVVGLPGSGKSTYLEKIGAPTLSSDAIRGILADDEDDQTIHNRVFSTVRYLLRHRIAIGRPVTYVDATHILPIQRRPYLEIGTRYNARVEALYFDVPVAVCKRRNRSRARIVPDEVIDLMAQRLVPPSRAEGFARVETIRYLSEDDRRTMVSRS